MDSNRTASAKKAASIGAALSRAKARARYDTDPARCVFCGNAIPIPEGERPSRVRSRRRFCNSSCAASHNNQGVARNPQGGTPPLRPSSRAIKPCVFCGSPTRRDKYCSKECLYMHLHGYRTLEETPKEALFQRRKSWQAARSSIQAHARRTLLAHNPSPACQVCGYDLHVEVAHRRSVSDFQGSATIAVINDIGNLMALCPNHHWEHDHSA
jgi:hypothetical protein